MLNSVEHVDDGGTSVISDACSHAETYLSLDFPSISHFLNQMSNLSLAYWLVKTTDSVCDFSCRALRRGSDAQCVLTAVQHVYQCHICNQHKVTHQSTFLLPVRGSINTVLLYFHLVDVTNAHCQFTFTLKAHADLLYSADRRQHLAARRKMKLRKKCSVQFCSIFLIPSSRGDAPHLENHRQRHIFPLYTNQFSLRSVFFCMCPTDTLTPEWRGCRVAGKRDWSGVTFLYANL